MLKNPYKARGARTYQLVHYVIKKQGDMATVHLHGRSNDLLLGDKRRIEYVKVRYLPGETDVELLRCAAWMSPSKWKVTWWDNLTKYGRTWYRSLDDRLLATLTDPSQISVSGG